MQFHRSISLSEPIMFNSTSILDNIHQAIINLELKPDNDEIQKLLIESISYLDKDFDTQIINELFVLILTCLSKIPNQTEEFYNSIFDDSKKNSNRLILFSKIYSTKQDKSFNTTVKDFIKDIIDQIAIQIQNQQDIFVINNFEIKSQFIIDFIIDITILSSLDENLISIIYPFVFSQSNITNPNINKFSKKIITKQYLSLIPEIALVNKKFLDNVPQEFLPILISKLTEPVFYTVINLLSSSFKDIYFWATSVVSSIIKKCIEFNYNINSNKKLYSFIINSINDSIMTSSVWSYFEKYDIKLPQNVADRIKKFPNPIVSLKILPSIEKVPLNIVTQTLMNSNDIQIFELFSNYDCTNQKDDNFSQKKFWIHCFSIISSSKQKYSESLINQFSKVFNNFVDKDNIYEIFEAMIFDKFPTTNNGNYFLVDLLDRLSNKENFIKYSETLLKKIIESKVIPLPSFWKIFKSDFIKTIYTNGNNDALILYALKFSNHMIPIKIVDTITIKPVKNEASKNFIVEFIKNYDLDLLSKMDEDSFAFCISVLLYIDDIDKPEINGLTKETILPFLAISLKYLEKNKYASLIPNSKDFLNLLKKAFKFLPQNKSLLNMEAADSIVANEDYLFQNDFSYQIFNVLINQLFNNSYIGTKLTLLQAIFKLSHKYTANMNVKNLFDKYCLNLYQYIIKNRSNIPNFDSLVNIGFNLDVFKLKRISPILAQTIEKSANYDEILNTLWFINNIYTNCPKLKISDYNNLYKFGNEIGENFDDLYIYEQYIKKHKIEKNDKHPNHRIYRLSNPRKIVNRILVDQHPEKNNFQFKYLFKIMMNEQSTANNYMIALFEKISNKQEFNPKDILEKYKKLYINYNSCFMNAFRSFYIYDSGVFIRKLNAICPTCLLTDFSVSFISILLKEAKNGEACYQAYYCLKHIASSFPFLFTKNQSNLFSTVFSALQHFILLFSCQKECNDSSSINKLKTALLALSFLFSTLCSVKVLDSFVPWIYKKITQFNQSQILAVTFIFNSLLNTQNVNKAMVAISSKYNLPNIVFKLLNLDVQENIHHLYKNNFYNILIKYYKLLNELNSTKDAIYVDELKNNNNPFVHHFNNSCTIYPEKLKPLNYPIPDNIEIQNFINDINEIRSFWLDYEKIEDINCIEICSLMINYDKSKKINQNNNLNTKEINIPTINEIKKIRYCAKQPYWVYKFIIQNTSTKISQDSYAKIKKVLKQLNNLPPDKNEEEMNYSEIQIDHFFASDFCIKELINHLIDMGVSNNNKKDNQLCKLLINEIIKNEISLEILIDTLNTYIYQNEKKYCTKNIIDFIMNLKFPNISIFKNDFKIKFINDFGNFMLNLALSPEYRKNEHFLIWVSDMLCSLDYLPDRAIHLICIMINNQMKSSNISNLCKIMNINVQAILQYILHLIFINQSENKLSYYYMMFNEIIECISLSIRNNFENAFNILEKAISIYKKDKWEPCYIVKFVLYLFNIITPERKDNLFYISRTDSNSSNDNKYKLNNAYPELIKTNPDFWNFYEKNYAFINTKIVNDPLLCKKLVILKDYPELLNFKNKLSDFRENMMKKISFNNSITINVDRSNILPSSFTFLKNKSRDYWLSNMHIKFIGEYGSDLGGLTRNWFSLIVNEILNPDLALFLLTQNNSYQPNPLSGLNQEHIEFFKFAGKIIAKAIIHGQYINAHLTTSFLRQMLCSRVCFDDLKDMDRDIYKSLKTILNEDVEQFGLNFTIDVDEYGVIKTVLLKEDGDKIDVTNENKTEYVKLYAEYKMRKSVIEQVNAFCEGFYWLISADEIKLFTPYELDLIICGNKKVDINDLRKNTIYRWPYTSDHPVINLLFNVLSKWNSDDLSKFLLFLTGSTQVPVNGFKEYKDKGISITIEPGGNKNRLCVAHTCFNILDLPEYENEEELNRKLLQSIQECHFCLI